MITATPVPMPSRAILEVPWNDRAYSRHQQKRPIMKQNSSIMKHSPAMPAGGIESPGDSVLFYIVLARVIGMVAPVAELLQPAGYAADHGWLA